VAGRQKTEAPTTPTADRQPARLGNFAASLLRKIGAPLTASANFVAAYAYSDNYLIDLQHAVIMDVEATTAIRQAEVGAAN
jgi:hypothetical protein